MPLINGTQGVLLALLLDGERYGLHLRDGYRGRTGEAMPLGTLYTTLQRMEDAGMVKSREGESEHERGGGRRRYFKITRKGRAAHGALLAAVGLTIKE